MQIYRIKFLKQLFELAKRCNYSIQDFEFSLYERTLEPFGFESCSLALDSILAETSDNQTTMPSCSFIAARILELSKMKNADSSDTASIIIRSFRNNGPFYHEKISYHPYLNFETSYKARYGSYAWVVIKRLGGYKDLFESWQASSSQETFILRLRRFIEANRSAIENELAKELTEDDQTPRPIEADLGSKLKASN